MSSGLSRPAWMLIVLLTCLAGCAHREKYPTCPHVHSDVIELERRPDRGCVTVDCGAIQPFEQVDMLYKARRATHGYRWLTPNECLCLAAKNSWLASLIEMEGQLSEDSGRVLDRGPECIDALARTLSRLRALGERNRSASEALQTFFLLAAGEGKRNLLAGSLSIVDQAIEQVKDLRKRGVQIDVDPTKFERQRMDLLADRAKLDLNVGKLNGLLRLLLHLDPTDNTPVWPAMRLAPKVPHFDTEVEVSRGLELRPDLAALELMCATLNEDTLGRARLVLQGADMSLGAAAGGGVAPGVCKSLKLLQHDDTERELYIRRAQLIRFKNSRVRTAAEEIRQAVYDVEAETRAIAIAREKLGSLMARRETVKDQRVVGAATPFDVTAIELQVFQGKSDLLESVVAWYVAVVKLRELQGVLIHECGYCLPPWPCECCPDCVAECRIGSEPVLLPPIEAYPPVLEEVEPPRYQLPAPKVSRK